VAQVVEHLPRKCNALCLKPDPPKQNKTKQKNKEEKLAADQV
jgi:hypothetical protein